MLAKHITNVIRWILILTSINVLSSVRTQEAITPTARWDCSNINTGRFAISDTFVQASVDSNLYLGDQDDGEYRPVYHDQYCLLFEGEDYAQIPASGDFPFYSTFLDNEGSTFNAWLNIIDSQRDQVIMCKQLRNAATDVIDKLCVGMKDGYFYGNLFNETIPFDDFKILEGWNFFSAVFTKDVVTGTFTKIRVISFAKGGMQMSTRIWSGLFTDNVDYDMMIGGKWDQSGVFLDRGFAGFVYQISIYSQTAMTMSDLDALVDWECQNPHLVNGITPDMCRFCPLYTPWPATTCLEDTYDTASDGTAYHGLLAAYDFGINSIQNIDTRPSVNNFQQGKEAQYTIYFGRPRPFVRDEDFEPHASSMHGLYFDGNDHMTVDYTDNIIFDKHFTVELWVRFTEIRVTQRYGLFQKVDFFGKDTPYFEFAFETDGSFRITVNNTDVLIIEDAYDGDKFVGDPDENGDGDSDAGGWVFIGVMFSGVYWPTHIGEDITNASWWNRHPVWQSKVTAYLHGPDGYEMSGDAVFTGYYNEQYRYPYEYDTVIGAGLRGFIRSVYIWDRPKPLTNMYFDVRRNHRWETQCDTFHGNPIVECNGCDQIVANGECFTDCQTRTYATDWAQCPYQYCTNEKCVTCYEDTAVPGDNQCTGCIPNAFMILSSRGDCQCNMGTYYDAEVNACEFCHEYCQSCFGPTNTECNSCVKGRFYIGDNTCIADCALLGDLWIYEPRTDSCAKCREHWYTLDHIECLPRAHPEELTNYNNEFLLLEFSQPVAYREVNIQSVFDIVINGNRSDYRVSFETPYWEQNQFEQNVMLQMTWNSSLYGDETLDLLVNPLFIWDINDYQSITRDNPTSTEYSPLTVNLEPFEYISLEELQKLETTGWGLVIALLAILLIHLLLFAIARTSLELFWVFLHTLQIIDFIPLLVVTIPTTLQLTFKYFNVVNLEFEIIKDGFYFIFDLYDRTQFEPDGIVNDSFDNYGKDSWRLILNSGSQLLILCIITVSISLIFLMRILFGSVFACGSFWKGIERQFEWNAMIRLYLIMFLTLTLSAAINLRELNAHNFKEFMSSIASLLLITLGVCMVPGLIYRLGFYRESFDTNYMKKRFSNIYLHFKDDHWFQYMHGALFFIRRLAFCAILLYIGDALTQLVVFQLLNFMMIIVLFFTRPYKQNVINYMALFNEFMIFIITCYMFAFLITDLDGSVHAGYATTITWLLIFTVGFNLLVVIPYKIRELCLEYYKSKRIWEIKRMARIERRFREFDAMRYVLHGLHLKDSYRFIQRRKREVIKDYEPSVSAISSDESQRIEEKLHLVKFDGKQKDADEVVNGESTFMQKVGESIKNRYQKTFESINREDEPPLERKIVSQEGGERPKLEEEFVDEYNPLPHNLDQAGYNMDIATRYVTQTGKYLSPTAVKGQSFFQTIKNKATGSESVGNPTAEAIERQQETTITPGQNITTEKKTAWVTQDGAVSEAQGNREEQTGGVLSKYINQIRSKTGAPSKRSKVVSNSVYQSSQGDSVVTAPQVEAVSNSVFQSEQDKSEVPENSVFRSEADSQSQGIGQTENSVFKSSIFQPSVVSENDIKSSENDESVEIL